MPTLLDLAGIEAPGTVEGRSMVGNERRGHLYGELGEGELASRMIHDGRYKLIYYPAGNRCQLFDLEADPQELTDIAGDPVQASKLAALKALLIEELYGSDLEWVADGALTGLPNRTYRPAQNRGLGMTRGHQWPVPPVNPGGLMAFFPEAPETQGEDNA